jgi:hypothetical protein
MPALLRTITTLKICPRLNECVLAGLAEFFRQRPNFSDDLSGVGSSARILLFKNPASVGDCLFKGTVS